MADTPLTSVGIAADLGFFQPPTNNPLTSNGSIGLLPRTIIEPGTVTFPASITFNQYGQVIRAVSGDGSSFNGLLSQSVVADYGQVIVPANNQSNLISFSTSALQKGSSVLIQPISVNSSLCGITGIYPTPVQYNQTGVTGTASSVVTVVLPTENNPISSFYWAIINPSRYVYSYVNPVGVVTLRKVNGLVTNINCSDYGIPNNSFSAYFLSISNPTGDVPVNASIVNSTPTSNVLSIFTTGECDVSIMVISTSLSLTDMNACILLNGGNITAPGSTMINNTSCFEVPSFTTSSVGAISCFSSLVVPETAVPSICGTMVNGAAEVDPSSWMQAGKGQIRSTYVYPNATTMTVPLLGMCYVNVFQGIGG